MTWHWSHEVQQELPTTLSLLLEQNCSGRADLLILVHHLLIWLLFASELFVTTASSSSISIATYLPYPPIHILSPSHPPPQTFPAISISDWYSPDCLCIYLAPHIRLAGATSCPWCPGGSYTTIPGWFTAVHQQVSRRIAVKHGSYVNLLNRLFHDWFQIMLLLYFVVL